MSDLLNIFCCSRLKEFQSIRLPSQNKPEILIPPPMSSSDLSSSDNMTTNTYNGATSIKILLEKAYSKKVSTSIIEEPIKLNVLESRNSEEEESIKPPKKHYLRNWSEVEDSTLINLYKKYGGKWDLIATKMGKTANQCSHHWRKIKPKEMKVRRLWSKEEDEKLIKLVKIHGRDWNLIAHEMPERNRKQIRDRYNNTLDPNIKKEDWTAPEDLKLLTLYKKFGPKWALISASFEGKRSEIMVKNRYNNHLKKKACESVVESENHDVSEQEMAEIKERLSNSNLNDKKPVANQDNLVKYLEGLNNILNPNLLCYYGTQWDKIQNKMQKPDLAPKTKKERDHISFYPHDIKASSGSDTFNKSPHLYESEKSMLNSLKNINIQDEKMSENDKKNMSLEYGSIEEVDEEMKKHSVLEGKI